MTVKLSSTAPVLVANDELHAAIVGSVSIVEPLQTKDYGCVEFTVEDPNGFRLVFSQEAPAQ